MQENDTMVILLYIIFCKGLMFAYLALRKESKIKP